MAKKKKTHQDLTMALYNIRIKKSLFGYHLKKQKLWTEADLHPINTISKSAALK